MGLFYSSVLPKFELLWGDCTKAEKELGWQRKVSFPQLVKMMVEADIVDEKAVIMKQY